MTDEQKTQVLEVVDLAVTLSRLSAPTKRRATPWKSSPLSKPNLKSEKPTTIVRPSAGRPMKVSGSGWWETLNTKNGCATGTVFPLGAMRLPPAF
jgi:hypothetical protein